MISEKPLMLSTTSATGNKENSRHTRIIRSIMNDFRIETLHLPKKLQLEMLFEKKIALNGIEECDLCEHACNSAVTLE